MNKIFPNGFEDWSETHYEMVAHLNETELIEGSMAERKRYEQGVGGLYLLATALTDEFEEKYKGVVWGEELDYHDTLEEFLNEKEKI